MAILNVKFRPSSVADREGSLYYQVIHEGISRKLTTSYKLYPSEWDARHCCVLCDNADTARQHYLRLLDWRISADLQKLNHIIAMLMRHKILFTADDIVASFQVPPHTGSFLNFMQTVSIGLRRLGKQRTYETYQSALSSFSKFLNGTELLLEDIDSTLMKAYEAWLKQHNLSLNTVSFYMRILRATYNRAVEQGLIAQRYPFKHVYTGIGKTRKRALSISVLKQLCSLDYSRQADKDYARHMLLFSFYTRGMSLIDMAFLRKTDLRNGTLVYRRRKTGQQLFIKWEPCMQRIVDRYSSPDSPYLLSIIRRPGTDERKQYLHASHHLNCLLKGIGSDLGLSQPLTHYVARHSWASAAHSQHIPLSVISEGMGHDSEQTTRIYLASLETSVIDRANNQILQLLLL